MRARPALWDIDVEADDTSVDVEVDDKAWRGDVNRRVDISGGRAHWFDPKLCVYAARLGR